MAASKPGLEELLNANSDDIALVLGNGINRYSAAAGINSWDALLMKIAADCGIQTGPTHQRLLCPKYVYVFLTKIGAGRLRARSFVQRGFEIFAPLRCEKFFAATTQN